MSVGSRLTSQRYLDLLHGDGERLLEASEGNMAAACPSCEGWTVDDLVFHIGSVYAHKLAALRLGRAPEKGEWQVPAEEASPEHDLAWCHAELHALAAELARLPSDAPAWTWWPPEQTVGFWQRRMALETAVHRVDAELASGAATPVADDLALDGIDEVLHVMLADSGVDDVSGPEVDGGRVTVTVSGTTIVGPASDLFLWLWGRGDAGRLEVLSGSAADLRALVRDATQ
ncbi:MAG: maleylpyruvate isomerase family mycothiol-dependent enzyme [Actinomycetota bacterium]|nr:maleylpyruvate isomerase family mycothiol-dependent enzyme [Actinomycetota bacterium]